MMPPTFKEFYANIRRIAEHKRHMKVEHKKRQASDDVELPEVPGDDEVEKVGKKEKEEDESDE